MTRRLHYIDWLRVLAVLLLFPFHTSRVFNFGEAFYVKSPYLSMAINYSLGFVDRWQMPLLFLLAGCSAYFSLAKRSPGTFARERWVRLGVPLLFGILVIMPPQTYVGARFNSGYTETFRTTSRASTSCAGTSTTAATTTAGSGWASCGSSCSCSCSRWWRCRSSRGGGRSAGARASARGRAGSRDRRGGSCRRRSSGLPRACPTSSASARSTTSSCSYSASSWSPTTPSPSRPSAIASPRSPSGPCCAPGTSQPGRCANRCRTRRLR